MPNYANGKIYKIEPIGDHDEWEIYYGSTTARLCDRWGNHKSAFKSNKSYTSIILFEKYGIENCHILLVEFVTANSKEELIAREAFYIRNNKCVNKFIPDRTKTEYQADNKDKMVKYRLNNKDKIAERGAKYRLNNKDKIAERGAKFYQQNKDKIEAIRAVYLLNNKDKIKKRRAEYYQKNKK